MCVHVCVCDLHLTCIHMALLIDLTISLKLTIINKEEHCAPGAINHVQQLEVLGPNLPEL